MGAAAEKIDHPPRIVIEDEDAGDTLRKMARALAHGGLSVEEEVRLKELFAKRRARLVNFR